MTSSGPWSGRPRSARTAAASEAGRWGPPAPLVAHRCSSSPAPVGSVSSHHGSVESQGFSRLSRYSHPLLRVRAIQRVFCLLDITKTGFRLSVYPPNPFLTPAARKLWMREKQKLRVGGKACIGGRPKVCLKVPHLGCVALH